MSGPQQTFQPRSEFVRTEATPQSYVLAALNGADTLRLHNLSRSTLSALKEAFGNETRLYGEANDGQVAEFVFRNSPWSTKSARSETLIVQLFTTLLAHQYTFVTSIDYGRQYLDKLSLTFSRAASPSGRLAADTVFALSFVTPTVLRVLHAPLHCTPAILQSVRSAWPRGVKDERKLGNGCWEFRLKGFGYFSAEKSDEALIPHVFALLRTFDTYAFKLVAGVPIGGRSRNKDLWILTAPGTSQTPSPHQPTLESETAYIPGPYTASPTVGTGGHAKFATEEPERTPLVAAGHARSASAPGTPPHRKPIPMAMPVPAITKPTPPVANPPMTMPVPSPAAKPSPQSKPSPLSKPAPVSVPIPPKRNSSLLRKFRASGVGRTASGRFRHPPPPPAIPQSGSGHARPGSLASGEIIYETPLPGQQPLPPTNGFVAPPLPPPIPEQVGILPSASRTNEELLPRGAFRDSAFSTSSDASHDVDVLWTGAEMAKGGPGEPLSLVREGEEIEARSPDVTKTMHEEFRPKSERAEVALAGPPVPRPIPISGSGVSLHERKMSIDGKKSPEGPTGRPSMHSKSGTESSTSSPQPRVQAINPDPTVEPEPEAEQAGSLKRWFGSGKTKTAGSRQRRRGLNQAVRTSKRVSID